MKPSIKACTILALLSVFSANTLWSQSSKEIAAFTSYKLEEKKNEVQLYILEAARRNIESSYRKMEIAQQNVDIEIMLSLTHPGYKAYAPGGDVWDYEKLKMYWVGGLKHVVSTQDLENNIRSFILKGDTAVMLIQQVWNRKQWMGAKIRDVRTDTYQTETWVHTTDGWKRFKVQDVTNHVALVDGKRVDIRKPYDPDAPEYKPEEQK